MVKSNDEILDILKDILRDPNDLVRKAMEYKKDINDKVLELYTVVDWDRIPLEIIEKVLNISNILYNNSDLDILLLEDGIYDIVLEKYKTYNKYHYQVGAEPVDLNTHNNIIEYNENEMIEPVRFINKDDVEYRDNMIFPEIIKDRARLTVEDLYKTPVWFNGSYITKRKREIKHEHPELVGTLDKCKYVINKQAEEIGVLNDSNVKIVERDWLFPLLGNIIPDQDTTFDIIATLKYDGVSIEADVTNTILSARSRGDTGLDEASDLTPLLGGYRFPYALEFDKPIGMKFEAIMNYQNLEKFNKLKGYNYKNGRTAIIGLIGSSDGYKYRDLITLVPLETDLRDDNGERLDRLVEIEFLNKYYCRDQLLRHTVLSGNYITNLFQIKRYVEEAEFARSYLPFMYDGVVLEFYDEKIRKALGRVNSVNKYAMAVKFNALKKSTIFRGYKFTIGQNGVITPMIYYDPVEFLGTIHPKSTGNSYQRFRTLDLRIGDIIDVTYVNDVITRVTKPDNSHNRENDNKPLLEEEKFPTLCPSCGTPIIFTEDSARCPNITCPERNIKRISSAIYKLGVQDIGEERMMVLGYKTLKEVLSSNISDLEKIGKNNAIKFYDQILEILIKPIYDYNIIGAIGFSNVAAKKWKIIFNIITLDDLIYLCDNDHDEFINMIECNTVGIGRKTIETIINEYPYFREDIIFINDKLNIMSSKGSLNESRTKVRFTGFRDKQLVDTLNDLGYDADDNAGVTKDTSILLVPYKGYSQGNKCQKAMKYGVKIIPVNEFRNDLGL